MKTKLVLLIIAICYYSLLYTATFTVKTDGTGDFTGIQEAIDTAEAAGDSIIVYPGIYYENIHYNGKDIFISSLFYISNNREHIVNTVINGSGSGYMVKFFELSGGVLPPEGGEFCQDAVLNGFTITRGHSGIHIWGSSPTISNCIITENRGDTLAGGIYATGYVATPGYTNHIYCNPTLSGNIIKNNSSRTGVGGIILRTNNSDVFDPIHKNSVYHNNGGSVEDIKLEGPSGQSITYQVVLDTFTINIKSPRFISGDCTFQVDNYFHQFVTQDLYVSAIGNDSNDGLSPTSPMQSIRLANLLVSPELTDPINIYIAPGVYHFGHRGMFPAIMRSNVNLVGAGVDDTFFEGAQPTFITSLSDSENYTISGITFRDNIALYNSSGNRTEESINLNGANGVSITDCVFVNCFGGIKVLFNTNNVTGLFKNLVFDGITGSALNPAIRQTTIENIVIKNQQTETRPDGTNRWDPLIRFGYNDHFFRYDVSNILIHNNHKTSNGSNPNSYGYSLRIFHLDGGAHVIMSNTTITDNSIFYQNGVNRPWLFSEVYPASSLHIYNSVFCGNGNVKISESDSDQIQFINTLYDFYTQPNPLFPPKVDPETCIYQEEEYPLFTASWDGDYTLMEGSMAIDSGTTNVPYFDLPLYDIAGNPRVMGSTIDMGAYEFIQAFADFEATPLSGDAPLTVQFTDLSLGEPDSWSWFFYGAGSANSFEQNPIHTYTVPGTYTVRLVVNGESSMTKESYIVVTEATPEIDDTLPDVTYLGDAYPNPFNPSTTIKYSLKTAGSVSLDIYNIKGQKVKTLVEEFQNAGLHNVSWNGSDNSGKPISSGVYFYQLKTEDFSSVKKLILLK
ncbi:MAG: T9SS type A sorting domain-containing protein [Candidatus Cloacimonetes bacterium]|nr:T9SS type A sorting domain-containing protein [Candidatus Cloacimonadota bacterium]